ncbi:MAG: fumarate hydratase [Eggerthellaceae bacterium]|nr:fumarate hydratase [Eggerthellaceae bacterium]
MKEINVQTISEAIAELCAQAACDLPSDVKSALENARGLEESEYGLWALDKIAYNIAIAESEALPLCQDTGLALVFCEVGQDVHIVGGSLEAAIQAGIAQGYSDNYLRKSMVDEPVFSRINTQDNTPAVIHYRMVEGDSLRIVLMPKGGGSENMSALAMLKPAQGVDAIKEFVYNTVVNAGGNPCPPTIVGVGIGGNAEKALLLSKEALGREVGTSNAHPQYARLEEELLDLINASGIGPQGFGGRITALAVHVEYFPTHIAMLPVGVSLNCHVARHKQVIL